MDIQMIIWQMLQLGEIIAHCGLQVSDFTPLTKGTDNGIDVTASHKLGFAIALGSALIGMPVKLHNILFFVNGTQVNGPLGWGMVDFIRAFYDGLRPAMRRFANSTAWGFDLTRFFGIELFQQTGSNRASFINYNPEKFALYYALGLGGRTNTNALGKFVYAVSLSADLPELNTLIDSLVFTYGSDTDETKIYKALPHHGLMFSLKQGTISILQSFYDYTDFGHGVFCGLHRPIRINGANQAPI